MKDCFRLLLIIAAIALTGCGGTMNGTVHAQGSSTPAILSGTCDTSNLPTAYMIGLGGADGCVSLTGSGNTGLPIPSAGTLQNLRVLTASEGAVVTVYINGTASALTCAVPGNGFAPGSNCSDTTHTVSVAAGDLVAVQAATTTASSIGFTQVSLEKQ
jgi:hypothetical protein